MSKNFYLQSADTSTVSVAENHTRTTSVTKSDSSSRGNERYDHDEYYDDDEDDDDDNPLPFPIPPARSDFLAPTFEPSQYLSTLAASRYQTLEDLRTELRQRSQLLSQELLDLVNAHHDDFTGLGASLRGGDDKIEEVRVGVLGFRREVEDVRRKVAEREGAVDALVAERTRLRADIELGRRLLDFEERISLLEGRLGLRGSTGAGVGGAEGDGAMSGSSDGDNDEDDAEDDDAGPAAASVSRISKRVLAFKSIEHMANRIGKDHPLVKAQQERISALRDTLLLDLAATLKLFKQSQAYTPDEQLKVLNLYNQIGASGKAVEALRG